jgi:spermidine synthase
MIGSLPELDMAPNAVLAVRTAVARIRSDLLLTVAFAGTLFMSALLLFAIQPLFARMVLPHVGGTPAVWSVALVFFQGMLLAGYAYAHALVRLATLRQALLIHFAVLAIAFFWLPVEMARGVGDLPETGVAIWLIGLFAASVGIPFFAVSANAPLLQAWFSRTRHPDAGDPYFLYGASNLGSFAALLAYPVLIEPVFGLSRQAELWAAGFLALMVGIGLCGLLAVRQPGESAGRRAAEMPALQAGRPGTRVRLCWMALAFLPSALLVAVTAHISTNLAAAPLLWVVPLALFLLTFVLTFRRRPLVPNWLICLAAPPVMLLALANLLGLGSLGFLADTLLHLLAFFAAAFVCHSDLVARRPAPQRLTEFYFLMSLGGVLGGVFSTLLAPVLFSAIVEYPFLLAASFFAIGEFRSILARPIWRYAFSVVAIGGVALMVQGSEAEWRERSFFGVMQITRSDDGEFRRLVHGTTLHGVQRLSDFVAGRRPEPLSYYTAEGPIASAIRAHRAALGRPLSIGVVGLGTGSMACHAEAGEQWRFFEIDPAVVNIATNPDWFSFLSRCQPEADIVLGDARQSLLREKDGAFDAIIVDAFSSDAIPVHLMTREALALFSDKLAPDGIVIMHISNKFMELGSVVAATAAVEGLQGVITFQQRSGSEVGQMRLQSNVAVLGVSDATPARLRGAEWKELSRARKAGVEPWTDDYSNIIAAIRRRQGL